MTATLWKQIGLPLVDAQNTIASERIVATAAQTVLTLTSFAYVLGARSVLVFKNGDILAPVIDYTEASPVTVQLVQPATVGDVFVVVGFIKVFDATTQIETIFADLKATYLGASATNPTVDGLGQPLQAGAMYFNTSTGLRVYTGGVWQTAGIPITGTLLAANNLNDVANLNTTRQNLGVRLYTVNVAMANDLDKKVTVANTAAIVGTRVIASVIAVAGDTLNDELEFSSVFVQGNCVAANQVSLFMHSEEPVSGTFVVCYLLQS